MGYAVASFDNAAMSSDIQSQHPSAPPSCDPRPLSTRMAQAMPPHGWFAVSALFHYLGPAFAVLLFPAVGVLGVAWFRIATAALVFAPFTRPWQVFRKASRQERWVLVALGATLAGMNTAFYLALEKLPIALVASIEFLGTIAIALCGVATLRNMLAFIFAVAGVVLLIDMPKLVAQSGATFSVSLMGLGWAFLNGLLFVLYVLLGHRIARQGAAGGVEHLGAAMSVALFLIMPIDILEAARVFGMPLLVLAGIGVGLCSSVIPYLCDQLAMSRLPRASLALLLTILPASATVIGAVVLQQIPGPLDILGIVLVMVGVALHKPQF